MIIDNAIFFTFVFDDAHPQEVKLVPLNLTDAMAPLQQSLAKTTM